MIVVMKQDSPAEQIAAVQKRIQELGFKTQVSKGEERTIIGVVGKTYPELRDDLETLPGVAEVIPISRAYKLASREFKPEDTVVQVGNVSIGSNDLAVMAGPCSIESEKQVMDTARAVKSAGANILRGGAFKPRSSPYSFRGMGVEGLKLLAKARAETGLPVITEVMTPADVQIVAEYADILQIGARNMQNFNLLDEVGKIRKPVMLKRGIAATYEEWLLAAEYILNGGNSQVILCERGVRTFESYTRNTFDVAAIPVIRRLSHLPIIADPSHGTGKWHLVQPVALAAVAAGAHGLMIEVHPTPDTAKSDGAQSLTFENFAKLMALVSGVVAAVGRGLPAQPHPHKASAKSG
ncbi:MAG: 3-deoxy-7-phosphoheptulonate synthase [Dehalococcoidia bacterium]|nr:3-deoxy-7-phosphoheptulonate synthase [Dehalococcoidia bacterium]